MKFKFKVLHLKFKRGGFTLAELVVAMGVFLIAITIAIGAFVQALKSQRVANYLMSMNSNASIALESMAREIRTGYNFSVSDFSPSLCQGIQNDILSFINFNRKYITYEVGSGSILRRECAASTCSSSEIFQPFTASNILVSNLCFIENQNTSNDPWRISIFLTIAPASSVLTGGVLNLQTTIASRILPQDLK